MPPHKEYQRRVAPANKHAVKDGHIDFFIHNRASSVYGAKMGSRKQWTRNTNGVLWAIFIKKGAEAPSYQKYG